MIAQFRHKSVHKGVKYSSVADVFLSCFQGYGRDLA